jgi:hypothetical protein
MSVIVTNTHTIARSCLDCLPFYDSCGVAPYGSGSSLYICSPYERENMSTYMSTCMDDCMELVQMACQYTSLPSFLYYRLGLLYGT